jgi:hypothetical protein
MQTQMGEVARYTGWLLHVMESLTSEDCQAGAVLAMKILTHLIMDWGLGFSGEVLAKHLEKQAQKNRIGEDAVFLKKCLETD